MKTFVRHVIALLAVCASPAIDAQATGSDPVEADGPGVTDVPAPGPAWSQAILRDAQIHHEALVKLLEDAQAQPESASQPIDPSTLDPVRKKALVHQVDEATQRMSATHGTLIGAPFDSDLHAMLLQLLERARAELTGERASEPSPEQTSQLLETAQGWLDEARARAEKAHDDPNTEAALNQLNAAQRQLDKVKMEFQATLP